MVHIYFLVKPRKFYPTEISSIRYVQCLQLFMVCIPNIIMRSQEEGITVTFRVDRCFSETEATWVTIVVGYKLLLQAIGAFLAFNIRKIKIKGLNDAREISAILYITTILILIVVVSNFVFGEYINVDGTVYSLCVSTSATCVLGFIFIPKVS